MFKGLGLRATAKIMNMNDATWARHANPWSGWSRVSILPLLAVAVWSRVWIGWWALVPVGAVLVWTWLNPRLFPPPVSTDNWMSKGVLGERIWLSRRDDPERARHVPVVRTLMAAAFVGVLLLLAGLALLDLTLTVAGILIAMLAKLWFLDRMVWVYSEAGDTAKASLHRGGRAN